MAEQDNAPVIPMTAQTPNVITLPDVSTVGVGKRVTIKCPIGWKYSDIMLEPSNLQLSEMKNIKVNVNGKTIQEFPDGTYLDNINQYYQRGSFANLGFLPIFFERPELRAFGTYDQHDILGLGTADLDTLTVTVEIASSTTSTNAPDLAAHATVTANEPMGLVTKVIPFFQSYAGSGQQEISDLPREGARFAAIHLVKSDVDDLELEVNKNKVRDYTKPLAEATQKKYDRAPQSSWATHMDFILRGGLEGAIATEDADGNEIVYDFRIRQTIGSSGDETVMVEYIAPLGVL